MLFQVDDLVVVAEGGFTGRVGVVVKTDVSGDGCWVRFIGKENRYYYGNDELEFAANMDVFEAYLKEALDNETPWMYVLMEMPNTNDEEIIVNPITNFEDKLVYYKKQYDAELKHKYVEGLRIVGYGFCESLAEIEEHINARFDDGEDEDISDITYDVPRIKVGSRVKIVGAMDSYKDYNGMYGIVLESDRKENGQWYDLLVKVENIVNDTGLAFDYDEVELVEEEPKFKVGDKIVVVNDLDYPERNGMTGTITKIVEDNSGYNYQTDMRISFTQVMCFKDEEIALVDESEIEVGDKVVVSGVTDSYAKYNGKTGVVFEKYEKAKWNYGVKIDGAIYVFGKGELIKIK